MRPNASKSNRRQFFGTLGGLLTAGSCFISARAARATGKRNVLLICVDDLRPVLGCYGGQAIDSRIM